MQSASAVAMWHRSQTTCHDPASRLLLDSWSFTAVITIISLFIEWLTPKLLLLLLLNTGARHVISRFLETSHGAVKKTAIEGPRFRKFPRPIRGYVTNFDSLGGALNKQLA